MTASKLKANLIKGLIPKANKAEKMNGIWEGEDKTRENLAREQITKRIRTRRRRDKR